MDLDQSTNPTPSQQENVSFTRHPEVAQLIKAIQVKDVVAQRHASESLLKSSSTFQPAVPGMLTMIASGDEDLRQCAAELLCSRAHWIKGPDANEFLVPALVKNLPSMSGELVGDLLVKATLSTAPELCDEKVAAIATAADRQLRDEYGVPLTEQTSIGLLAERLPLLLSPTVGEATRVTLQDFRQEFFLKQGVLGESGAYSHWMLRVSMTSLFGQRLIITGHSRDGNRVLEGRQLEGECRRYIQTFQDVAERVGLPDWAGAYHLLFTCALVLPHVDRRTRETLLKIQELFAPELPGASELMARLLDRQNLTPDLERIVDEFDPSDVEQTIFFASALMETILTMERGQRDLELARAQHLDTRLESAIVRITDPLLGYFAAELRRVMRKQLPELVA